MVLSLYKSSEFEKLHFFKFINSVNEPRKMWQFLDFERY